MAIKNKIRNIAAIGLTSILIGACSSGLSGGPQPGYTEDEVAARVAATMRADENKVSPTPTFEESGWAGSGYCLSNPCPDSDLSNIAYDVRQPYHPIKDCAPSRLHVGDYVYVSYGGTPNGIRSEPDVHPADNILGNAYPGEAMTIVGGPECSYGWILWDVRTDAGLSGWTPESSGEEFWLIPIDGPREIPSEISSNPRSNEVYQEVSRIMGNSSYSDSQKRERIRVVQNTFGEEIVTTIMRYVPVYNSREDRFESFDSYTRGFASDYGYSTSNAPIERDPVGASLSIFFNPSSENITKMLGLDDWFP